MSDDTQSRTMDCPDCHSTVSKRAVSCPHCGAPIAAAEEDVPASNETASGRSSEEQTVETQLEAQPDLIPAFEETTGNTEEESTQDDPWNRFGIVPPRGLYGAHSSVEKTGRNVGESLVLGNITFAKEHLTEGETIIHAARFHPVPIWVLNYTMVTLIVVSALSVVAGNTLDIASMDALLVYSCCVFFVWLVLGIYFDNVVHKTEFVLTNKRIIAKWGFLRTVIHELPLEKIESVNYGQTVIERWFWYGIGRLTVRGTGGSRIKTFRYLVGALEFRKRILDQIDKVSGS